MSILLLRPQWRLTIAVQLLISQDMTGAPLGFDYAHLTTWPAGKLNTYFGSLHRSQSPTTPSLGALGIPQLSGSLTLNGRDSKIHVNGYDVGQYMLQYSTAEVFTWHAHAKQTVLVVYSGDHNLGNVTAGQNIITVRISHG